MTNGKNSSNKTLNEMMTEYMQEYYGACSDLGENHPKTKLNFACWQALKNVVSSIRDQKSLVVVPPPTPEITQPQPIFYSFIEWVKTILQKLFKK
jgi:hypothetical protein